MDAWVNSDRYIALYPPDVPTFHEPSERLLAAVLEARPVLRKSIRTPPDPDPARFEHLAGGARQRARNARQPLAQLFLLSPGAQGRAGLN
jgi:hypothetical protein